jgi:hypothetical protein
MMLDRKKSVRDGDEHARGHAAKLANERLLPFETAEVLEHGVRRRDIENIVGEW